MYTETSRLYPTIYSLLNLTFDLIDRKLSKYVLYVVIDHGRFKIAISTYIEHLYPTGTI